VKETTDGTLLGGQVKYRQFTKGHRSGFEPILLAAAIPAKPGEKILEAGCGAGAALLCLAHRVPGITGIGAEIDPALVELANENFKNNGLQHIHAEKSDVNSLARAAIFDHVMANPPWHDSAGTNSPDLSRALAHHAGPDALAAWVAALARCLKPRGTVTLILPAAGFSEAAACLAALGCGGISLFPLWPRAGQPAKQIIIAATRGGKNPDKILPGLILHDEGGITQAAEAVLRGGGALTR
jgi:tRNA1(Val) A37 N6-methylase TrmN6